MKMSSISQDLGDGSTSGPPPPPSRSQSSTDNVLSSGTQSASTQPQTESQSNQTRSSFENFFGRPSNQSTAGFGATHRLGESYSSSNQHTSLFGQSQPNSSVPSPFGSGSGSGLFGSSQPSQNQPSAAASLFGAPQTQPYTSTSGPFGSSQPSQNQPNMAASLFANQTKTSSGGFSGFGGSPFGSSQPSQNQTNTATSLFTAPLNQTNTSTGSIFGSCQPSQIQLDPAASVFGAAPNQPMSFSYGLFAKEAPASAPKSTSKFVDSPSVSKAPKSPNNGASQKEILKQGPYSDIKAGKYSDFRVKCFEKLFNLHRVMVCSRSPFFAAALRPETFLESKTAEVSLPDDDPRIFTMFIQLVYLGELDAEDTDSKPEGAMDYVKLYIMADKYGSPTVIDHALKLALPEISEVIMKASNGHGSSYDVEMTNWETFKTITQEIFANLPSPTNSLRVAVVKEAAWKWRYLRVKKSGTLEFLRTVPDFAVEVLNEENLLLGL